VAVNGFAIRVIRKNLIRPLTTAALAAAAGIDRSYLTQIELGKRTNVSPAVFRRLCAELIPQDDPRAILALPHADSAPLAAVGE
jgi:transcriptional regulator with XRE-family HTH domain